MQINRSIPGVQSFFMTQRAAMFKNLKQNGIRMFRRFVPVSPDEFRERVENGKERDEVEVIRLTVELGEEDEEAVYRLYYEALVSGRVILKASESFGCAELRDIHLQEEGDCPDDLEKMAKRLTRRRIRDLQDLFEGSDVDLRVKAPDEFLSDSVLSGDGYESA